MLVDLKLFKKCRLIQCVLFTYYIIDGAMELLFYNEQFVFNVVFLNCFFPKSFLDVFEKLKKLIKFSLPKKSYLFEVEL